MDDANAVKLTKFVSTFHHVGRFRCNFSKVDPEIFDELQDLTLEQGSVIWHLRLKVFMIKLFYTENK